MRNGCSLQRSALAERRYKLNLWWVGGPLRHKGQNKVGDRALVAV